MWQQKVGEILLNYSSATPTLRNEKLLLLTEIVRRTLAKEPLSLRQPTHQQSHNSNSDKAYAHKITSLAKLGAWQAVTSLVTSRHHGIYEPTPDVTNHLQSLFPQRKSTIPVPPAGLAVTINAKTVRSCVIRKLQRGKAAGLDGWTRELFIPIVQVPYLLSQLTAVIQDLLSARVSESVANRLRAAPLYPFKKLANSTTIAARPIAVESAWLRLASQVALTYTSKHLKETLSPAQFGMRSAEHAVHQARKCLSSRRYMTSIDCTNAFNAYDRAAAIQKVYADTQLQPLWGLMSWAFSQSSMMCVYSEGTLASTIQCVEGSKQGSSLSSILFMLAIDPILRRLQTRLTVVAYVDDVTLGSDEPPSSFLPYTKKLLASIGLVLNTSKTQVLSRDATEKSQRTIKVLGAILGYEDAVIIDELKGMVNQQYKHLCANLLRLDDPQIVYHILRFTANAKLNYILRTHPPSQTSTVAKLVDDKTEEILRHHLQLRDLSLRSRTLLKLPLALGGLGIMRSTTVQQLAYAASLSSSSQRELVSTIDTAAYRAFVETLPAQTRQQILSAAKPSACRLWTDPSIRLSKAAFIIATKLRLLHPVFPSSVSCVCGSPATNAHVLTCPSLPGNPKISRHDAINTLLFTAAGKQSMYPIKEPKHYTTTTRERPDLQFVVAPTTYAVDITVVHTNTGAASATKSKNKKWQTLCGNIGMTFYPFVVEHTAAFTEDSLFILHLLAPHSPDDIVTTFNSLSGAIIASVHEGNAAFFHHLMYSTHFKEQPLKVYNAQRRVMANTFLSPVFGPLTSA